ncbi:MAG TPA: tRNA (adenosine(37)-N6)-threonylcarbamoyltransferase complex dimerization subunit type 1 TsaB [Devosia sp.]|nr:tRNA (adenosine(37)-N6)-threonylcarbamoyltransferase complex dimerization subunit type 1 TsaB [Devosia sp.]
MHSGMNAPATLVIDTSGPHLQLALVRGGEVTTLVEPLATGHAEILFVRLASFLKRNNLTYDDVSRIAVTTGPGSFTGLRIGISAARGLALALDIESAGIPNLFALSLMAPATNKKPISVVLDARRSEAYAQRFSSPGQPLDNAVILPLALAEKDYRTPDMYLMINPRLDIAPVAEFAHRLNAGNLGHFPPVPTYIRAADAKPQTNKWIALQGKASAK